MHGPAKVLYSVEMIGRHVIRRRSGMPVDDERILGPTRRFDDDEVEASLRPRRRPSTSVSLAQRKS